jgi:hypothetical protein
MVGAILALGAGSAIAQTETLYVIEQLVVSVNTEPDGAGERVDQIKSGDRVEVLEKQGEQARVRLSSGQEGWVRSSYLSAAPPLREQLKARTDELEKLRAEKTKLETELASAKKAASAAAAAPAPSPVTAAPPPSPASVPAPASGIPSSGPSGSSAGSSPAPETAPANPPMFSSDGVMPSRPSWLLAIAASLLTLVAGFALGWRVLDKRIRAKYGGLRIY